LGNHTPLRYWLAERIDILYFQINITFATVIFPKARTMNIKEDNNNIYIKDYIIPKGREKEDIKTREKIINAIYRNPCVFILR